MKNTTKRMLTAILSIMLLVSIFTVSVLGAKGSATHLYDRAKTAEFNKKNIVVTIGTNSYGFSASGNGSWKNDSYIPELDLDDEGANVSLSVIITDEEGNEYRASLVNHSDENGNNKNNKNGTDTYDIIGISRIEKETESEVESESETESLVNPVPLKDDEEIIYEESDTAETDAEEDTGVIINLPEAHNNEGEELVDIGDEEVPLTEIADEEVPKTGDSIFWYAMLLISLMGLCALFMTDGKKTIR